MTAGQAGAHPAGDVSCYEANLQDKKMAPVAHTINLADPVQNSALQPQILSAAAVSPLTEFCL